jgi:hypothetical protein
VVIKARKLRELMGGAMRKRQVFAAAAAVASIAGSVWSASAWAAPGSQGPSQPSIAAKQYCPYGTTVVYVTQNVVGQQDVGLANNPWAADSYQRIISVVRTGPNTYCGATRVSGSFASILGTSPGLTGQVYSGDTGYIYGGERTTVFTAKWRPSVPTSGSIGTVYCDPTFGCPAAIDWSSLYFQDAAGYDTAWWTFSYHGGTHGNWRDQADGSLGDIVG